MTDLKTICKRINAFYENGDTALHFDYIENLHDGRGYTAGYAGFCSGTGDLVQVVEKYCKLRTASLMVEYLPRLRELAKAESGDVSGLEGFKKCWTDAAQQKSMEKAQHEVCDKLYWEPAAHYAADLGIKFPVGQAILYDTIIQHGDGGDPDAIGALIKRTNNQLRQKGKIQTVGQAHWLTVFLNIRHKDLLHPSDPSTQKVWAESADRAISLLHLLESGNLKLETPFEIHAFGGSATIT